MSTEKPQIEVHPFEPFIPEGARMLVMGTFPPPQERWSFSFYYPNKINDFWRIMGLIEAADPLLLTKPGGREFDLPRCIDFLIRHHIALSDTGEEVRRLKGNASDKFLEIVKPRCVASLLSLMPDCTVVATTGEKAAQVVADQTGTPLPRMGQCFSADIAGREVTITRMPSTSRAYPLSIARKADYYRLLFELTGQPV